MEEAGQENTALSEWRAWESDYNERNKTSFVFCFFFFLLMILFILGAKMSQEFGFSDTVILFFVFVSALLACLAEVTCFVIKDLKGVLCKFRKKHPEYWEIEDVVFLSAIEPSMAKSTKRGSHENC
ncbi:MAG: hypothetical protein KBC21_01060 [Candidatus Pacebacteria bacterium]|jgi:hypothetical protein|nr:hypothetical protein [Candidatus Paceibacterota bacterium]